MNINLHEAVSRFDLASSPLGGESMQTQIEGSAEILAQHPDTRPIGPAVLIPMNQTEYPGSYQVWFPINDEINSQGSVTGCGAWIHVTPAGEVITQDFLPTAYDMRDIRDGKHEQ